MDKNKTEKTSKRLLCDLCEIEFKKGDIVYEEVKTIYQGNYETYPVEVLHRWCFDCQVEMDKRIDKNAI